MMRPKRNRLTMHQMAIPPIVMAAPKSSKLYESSAADQEGVGRKVPSDLLIEHAPRRCPTIDQLKRGYGADETDNIAQRHEARIVRPGHNVAIPQLEERMRPGNRHGDDVECVRVACAKDLWERPASGSQVRTASFDRRPLVIYTRMPDRG